MRSETCFSRLCRKGPCLFACLFFCAFALAGEVATVELDAPQEIQALLKQYVYLLRMDVDAIPEAGPDRSALTRRARREVAALLATEGYFSPEVRIDRSNPEHWRLVVEPGQRTVVGEVDIQFQSEDHGPGAADELKMRHEQLQRDWAMPPGTPFRQENWESAKQSLLDALRDERYAAAKFVSSKAEVDPDAAKAWIKIVIDTGPTFRLGSLEVSGLRDLPPDFVARYNTLREGSIYRRRDLLAFQESLQSAPQLAVVVVSVAPDPQRAAAIPVQVAVTEAPPRRIRFGLGASSNTGYRVETTYRHLNLFGNGWELASGVRLEQRRQSLYTDLFLPPTNQGRHRDSFGVGLDRSDLEGLKINTQAAGVTRTIKRGHIETQITTRVQHETIQPDDAEKSSYNTLTLNLGRTWRAVDNVLNPRQGHVLEFQLGGGLGLSPQANDFGRFYGRIQQYVTLGSDNVLTLRVEGGYTHANTRDGVPQDFLFRAGGTQSVRGYAYRSLGVKEGSAIVGGRILGAGSLELVHWFVPSTGLAVFVDSGDAADTVKDFSFHTGYGFGMRWLSPAGPLAVDLGWGQGKTRPRLHFGVSVAF
ncbi:MAG: autotransporter assembly complex protein TamA [Azoarcus sp.]|jgi:translocation and assembly module TamA|nr:autotransporter assembly complex protein TamA [Azoarcus sp.]